MNQKPPGPETIEVPGWRLQETIKELERDGVWIESWEMGSTNGKWRLTIRRPKK